MPLRRNRVPPGGDTLLQLLRQLDWQTRHRFWRRWLLRPEERYRKICWYIMHEMGPDELVDGQATSVVVPWMTVLPMKDIPRRAYKQTTIHDYFVKKVYTPKKVVTLYRYFKVQKS